MRLPLGLVAVVPAAFNGAVGFHRRKSSPENSIHSTGLDGGLREGGIAVLLSRGEGRAAGTRIGGKVLDFKGLEVARAVRGERASPDRSRGTSRARGWGAGRRGVGEPQEGQPHAMLAWTSGWV